ncbi:MAG: hypothetical protein AVDCRST_MAG15-1118, partial [uncultured Rubellimicrobium sp.]
DLHPHRHPAPRGHGPVGRADDRGARDPVPLRAPCSQGGRDRSAEGHVPRPRHAGAGADLDSGDRQRRAGRLVRRGLAPCEARLRPGALGAARGGSGADQAARAGRRDPGASAEPPLDRARPRVRGGAAGGVEALL